MKKRLLSAFLCAAMLATMIPAAFASDLDGHWSKNFIEYLDDEGKGRGLHSGDAEHLSVLTIFPCIKSGGVHTENPVTDGTGKSGKIE